jgi:hypothetical protein
MPVSRRTLDIMHGIAGAFHLGQAGVLTYLVSKNNKEAYKWPITRLGWEEVLTEKTVRFNLGILLPTFPLLSSVNHIVSVAFPSVYDSILRNKVNWLKWTEYSLSAGVMVILIGLISSVTEVRTIVSLAILNVALQMMGLLIEKRKAENAPKGELIGILGIAWAIFMAMWSQIIIAFYTVVFDSDTKPPDIVYSIIWVMFSLFASFGIAQTLYVFDVIEFTTYEATFIALSLSAKTLLSWLVYGGIVSGDARFEEE